MANQMPAEMREQAERLRLAAGGYYEREMRAGADALDRLADVIEYVEMREWASANGVLHIGSIRVYQTPEETVAHVGRLARGETNKRETP